MAWTADPLSPAAVVGDALLGSALAVDGRELRLTARLGKGANGVAFKAVDRAGVEWAVKLLVTTKTIGGVAYYLKGSAAEAAADAEASAAAAAAVEPSCVHDVRAVQVGSFSATLSAVGRDDLWSFTWPAGDRRRDFDTVTADAFRQVLRVVGGLHDKGWVIGDIKPDNFFVFVDANNDRIVKAADLGGATWPERTTDAKMAYSEAFTDPAILIYGVGADGKRRVVKARCSQQGDAFSVGATGFFLLCGQYLKADRGLVESLPQLGVVTAETALAATAGRHLGRPLSEVEALFVSHLARLLAKGDERATVNEAFYAFEDEAAFQLR